jgi:hypothetical protein
MVVRYLKIYKYKWTNESLSSAIENLTRANLGTRATYLSPLIYVGYRDGAPVLVLR